MSVLINQSKCLNMFLFNTFSSAIDLKERKVIWSTEEA